MAGNRIEYTAQNCQMPPILSSYEYAFYLAYQVEYQCAGFLEKNRDTVREEQINILRSSKVGGDQVEISKVNVCPHRFSDRIIV